MKSLDKLMIAAALALPLVATAQTTAPGVTPADQPRTNLEKQQTTENGNAPKYGGPGTDTGGSMSKGSRTDAAKTSKKAKSDTAKANRTAPGDAPTYPAPARDGTPTK